MTEKYLNLIADQIESYFKKYKNYSDEFTSGDASKTDEMVKLKQNIRIKDELLVEQLHLIETLIIKLFVIDRGLQFLEARALSVTNIKRDLVTDEDIRQFQDTLNRAKILLQNTTFAADNERKILEEKLKKSETEKCSLNHTLLADKSHIEQLDKQFVTFVKEREELKKRNKNWEKKSKSLCKEKEAMLCKCESLKEDIGQLKEENKRLQNEVQKIKSQLESANNESVRYKEKLRKIAEENRKSVEQIASLNKENYSLSCSLNVLRDRSEYTSNFTNEEIGKMNVTIGELRSTLESTKILQEKEDQAHEEEIESLNDTINTLQQQLQISKEKYEKDLKTCKICRGKSKVGFLESSEIQVNLDNNDPGLVKIINDTKAKMTSEIDKRNCEIESLKTKISELTTALNTCEERAANLQEAVALYSNSMNVLETSRNEAKCQIDNQKVTIVNLQRALVEAKTDVDVLRKKGEDNVATNQVLMEDLEDESELYRKMAENLYKDYEKLQNLNFDLEVEHCDSLKDVDSLEYQLNKIKLLLKFKEEQLKKLAKQKKCYEEVIAYFKKEMGLMAEQLGNLQQVLTLSNDTANQESAKLMTAFHDAQSQLRASEQKVQLESQLNQFHQAKIAELQLLVDKKEAEISKHNETISNIQQTLNDSLKSNQDLQKTIKNLNDTVANLQGGSKQSSEQFQQQIGDYCDKVEDLRRSLNEKTAESLKLEMDYNNEKRQLQSAQRQLQQTKQSQNSLTESLDECRQKLTRSEENNARLTEECENLQSQVANLTRKEAVKDLEIKRYRKIVADLRAVMKELNEELNKNLAQKEMKGCKMPNCRKRFEKDDPTGLDVCLTCPCEVEFYQKMVENLKNSLTDLKTQLEDAQQKNQVLADELKQKDGEIVDLKRSKDELNQKLSQLRSDNKKIGQLQQEMDQLGQELQAKSMQLTDVKQSANQINSSKCVQLACAQEEIGNLKNELSNYLNKNYSLKKENDQLNCTVCCLNDKIKILKDQIDQNLFRIKNLSAEKETAIRKYKELLEELRSMQSANKQKRILNNIDSLRQLEADIEELKSNKEEICSESRNVIKNVRAWVLEQKRINSFVVQKELQFIVNSENKEVEGLIPRPLSPPLENRQTKCKMRCKCCANRPAMCAARRAQMKRCISPCSLGSQGRGGTPSPDLGLGNEWYATNFQTQTESEAESDEEGCVNSVEQLTEQIRKSNMTWIGGNNNLRVDRRVSKDK